MINLSRTVWKSKGRSKQREIDRMAEALITDLKSGKFLADEPSNRNYPQFAGKNERTDHDGFVNWLFSQDFQDTMDVFHEASIMNGIESIG